MENFKDFLNEMDDGEVDLSQSRRDAISMSHESALKNKMKVRSSLIDYFGPVGGKQMFTKWVESGEVDFKDYLLKLVNDIKAKSWILKIF